MRIGLLALVPSLLLTACAGEALRSGVPATPQPNRAQTPSEASVPAEPTRSATPSPTEAAASDPALTSEALRDAIGAPAIRAHLEELQRIADANGGNRADGTAGFAASVEYLERRLTEAGYSPQRHEFAYDDRTSVNLFAERPGRLDSEVLMVGAHVDSVPASPGINDDGTGIATVLALAERLAEFERPEWTIRFAFWGAEEPGLKGSIAYVEALDPADRERLAAYLNLEMLGSPNYIRYVHSDAGAPPGSDAITSLLALYFGSVGLAWDPFDLTGKTDHAAFSSVGIPTGGLFGGGREPKTDDQAARFGGTAGEPADPCSDAACDTIANINDTALDEMADAIAHVVATLAAD